jgi:hypothetical protein
MTGKNGNGRMDKAEKQLAEIRELLQMTALQTAKNARDLESHAREWRAEMKVMRNEHNREMREIRVLFKQMIRPIAV